METIRARMGPDPTGADGTHDRPSEVGGPTPLGKAGLWRARFTGTCEAAQPEILRMPPPQSPTTVAPTRRPSLVLQTGEFRRPCSRSHRNSLAMATPSVAIVNHSAADSGIPRQLRLDELV
jgi:hypothetical protein